MRCNSARTQERHFSLFKLASPEVGPCQVLQHLHIWVLVELLQAVLVHLEGTIHEDMVMCHNSRGNLNRRDVLPLLNIDVPYVEPHITEVSSGFTHL